MKSLTKAEEQLMQVLWKIEKGFLKDIVDAFPNPKPASTTVSTILKILETKKMVGHTTFGKSNEYHPLVSKNDYRNKIFNSFFKNYFNDSVDSMLSYFVKEKGMSVKEVDDILKKIKKK